MKQLICRHGHLAAVFLHNHTDGPHTEAMLGGIRLIGFRQTVGKGNRPGIAIVDQDREHPHPSAHGQADNALVGAVQPVHGVNGVVHRVAEQRINIAGRKKIKARPVDNAGKRDAQTLTEQTALGQEGVERFVPSLDGAVLDVDALFQLHQLLAGDLVRVVVALR